LRRLLAVDELGIFVATVVFFIVGALSTRGEERAAVSSSGTAKRAIAATNSLNGSLMDRTPA
jgi:hypothetical protein